MAKTKATGATKLGRDSLPKSLGIKLFDGEKVRPGMIIVRQRGTKVLAGQNTKRGSDDTIYALKEGIIKFQTKKIKRFDNSQRITKVVAVQEVSKK